MPDQYLPVNKSTLNDNNSQNAGEDSETSTGLLTQKQLAALLDVSERKLESDRHQGIGIPFLKFGRRVLYHPRDVDAYLSANKFTSTAEAKQAFNLKY